MDLLLLLGPGAPEREFVLAEQRQRGSESQIVEQGC
jgi:hypothetical protein